MAHGSAIWGFPAPTCSPAAATTTAPSSTSSSNPWRKLCRSSWVLRKRLRVDQRLRRDLSNIVLMRKGRLVRRPFRIVPPELCSDALASQCRQDSLRRVRRPMKANLRRIKDCITDCRDGTVDANLGHRFGTPWPSRLVGVDENDLSRWHVAARQNLVVEERGIGNVAVGPKMVLLGQRKSYTICYRAHDLPAYQVGIDRNTAVDGCHILENLDLSRELVHFDLHKVCRKGRRRVWGHERLCRRNLMLIDLIVDTIGNIRHRNLLPAPHRQDVSILHTIEGQDGVRLIVVPFNLGLCNDKLLIQLLAQHLGCN